MSAGAPSWLGILTIELGIVPAQHDVDIVAVLVRHPEVGQGGSVRDELGRASAWCEKWTEAEAEAPRVTNLGLDALGRDSVSPVRPGLWHSDLDDGCCDCMRVRRGSGFSLLMMRGAPI